MEGKEAGIGAAQTPVISGYDVLRCLGSGAQATVWLVQPHGSPTLLAAKCFMPEGVSISAPADDSFESGTGSALHNESEITREWRVMANYDHEHLLSMRGVEALEGQWCGGRALLTDYAAGGSLQDLVAARGPLSVGETVTVLTPLGQVLSFLHGNGVIHGDVSPGNVLFTAHGKPVLGDLGFAMLAGQPPLPGSGTPGFFSSFDSGKSAASDVYSMAALGWFALTGWPPPETKERLPLSLLVPGVPGELAAALEAGLAEDAGQRPTAAAMAQSIFRSARAESLALAESVHPSVLPQLLTRRAQRGPSKRFWRHGGLAKPNHVKDVNRPRQHRFPPAGAVGNAPFRSTRLWLWLGILMAVAGIAAAGWQGSSVPAGVDSSGDATFASSSVSPADARPLPEEIRRGLASTQPEVALPALAWVRNYALSSGQFALMASVNAVGSPAMIADSAVVQALETSQHSFAGLETGVSQAKVVASGLIRGGSENPTMSSTVAATITTTAFAELDARGSTINLHEREQQQELVIVLVSVSGRWMIQEINAGP
ncbi:hypothetical protein GCM10025779_11520 [Arthrobacter cryoconiti]|nr:protein kinase [Arthrobacter cryoconiti]